MKSFLIQVLIVILVFNIVASFRESGMLSSWTHEPAPMFTLHDFDKQEIALIETNHKKTILYFFAPWCSICRVSIQNLQQTYEKHSDITIKAVALDYDNEQSVLNFAEDLSLKFPILYGNEQVKTAYKVSAYPSYYVVNEQGEIEHRSMGYSTELGLFIRSL